MRSLESSASVRERLFGESLGEGTSFQVVQYPPTSMNDEKLERKATSENRIILRAEWSSDFSANPLKISLKLAETEDEEVFESGQNWRKIWTDEPNPYPPVYTHDLSFWIPKNLYRRSKIEKCLWLHAGDFVDDLEYLDESYFSNDGSRRSITLRLRYKCHLFALSSDLAWFVHIRVIGGALAREFGAEIR